jgi:hypothetical protein
MMRQTQTKGAREMANEINHIEYEDKVKTMSDSALRYTIEDCKNAVAALPSGGKVSFYLDEINYCAAELNRRAK